MKKLLIVVAVLIIILSGKNNSSSFSLQNFFKGEYVAYTNIQTGEDCINLGSCYMSTSSQLPRNIIGESVKVKNLEPLTALKQLSAKLIRTETLENGAVVMYAYSSQIPTHINDGEHKINIQLAYYEEYSIVGWPLILSSF